MIFENDNMIAEVRLKSSVCITNINMFVDFSILLYNYFTLE